MFGRRIPAFKILGFDVGVDVSWLFLALLITWSLAAGVFPADAPGLSLGTYWLMGLAGAGGLFLSVLIHELSHSLVARHYGLSMKGITLFLFGGVAEMEGEPESPKVEFRMAIIGPIVSIGLGILFYAIRSGGKALQWPQSVDSVFVYLATINILLAAFNLLPAFPLDGGRVFRASLWKWKGDFRKATEISAKSGNIFGWGLFALGIWAFLRGNFISGMWWVLIGMFLKNAAKISYQQVLVREALRGETISRFVEPDPKAVPAQISLEEFVADYLYRYYQRFFPVTEGGRLLGYVDLDSLKAVPQAQWPFRLVGDLVTPCTKENTVPPDMDAQEALKLMAGNGTNRLIVARGERLIGVVSLKDMLKKLSLRLEVTGYEHEAAA